MSTLVGSGVNVASLPPGAVSGNVTVSQPPPAPTNQALINTSSPSRAVTTQNVNKLQSITQPPAATTDTPQTTTSDGKVLPTSGVGANANGDAGTWQVNQTTGINEFVPAGSGGSSDSSTTAADPNAAALASITDPGLRAQYQTQLDSLDSEAAQAKSNIASIQAMTADNDPATQALVASITSKYDQAISLMNARNTQVLGKANASVGAFGGLGQMSQNFLNDEQQQADSRVQTLANQEQSLIMQARAAFQTNNVKALNDAMTQYDDINKQKLDALNQLLTATNKQVTEQQAQQKIDAAATKQSVSLDISKSTNLGTAIAKNLADSGITDQGQIDDYIQSMADEYGITNPDILKSAVTKAQQAQQKLDSSTANTADTITNRNARTSIAATKAANTNSSSTFKVSEGISKVTLQMESVKGSDGYIDPQKWIAARTNWNTLGGTDASFNSNFKKYLNPASYTLAGFKAPASTGPQYTTN